MKKPKIVIITGQTATGKTTFSQKYADEHDGELINCDSRQIYKDLTIVTGKDVGNGTFTSVQKDHKFDIGYYKNTKKKYPHIKTWLYDIVSPDIGFSAHDYKKCTAYVLSDILKRKKLPVVVGGTYHYIDYLFYQDNPIPVPPDRSLREQLALLPVQDLQQELYQRDPELLHSLNTSDRQNPQRLIRKIEIATSCQANERHQLKDKALSAQYDIEIHGFIHTSRKKAAEKIECRVRDRLKAGAVDETRKILHKKYTQSCPGLQALGYKQIIQYLKGELAYNELVALWTRSELQYAKRQETLMKKNPDLIWHEIT